VSTWGNGNHFQPEQARQIRCPYKQQPAPLLGGTSSSGPVNTSEGAGRGRLNGKPKAIVRWSFTDNGEPGTREWGHIEIYAPGIDPNEGLAAIVAEELLAGVNYQAHR
jgi:hypothetical protein